VGAHPSATDPTDDWYAAQDERVDRQLKRELLGKADAPVWVATVDDWCKFGSHNPLWQLRHWKERPQ
jgi:hypothetical protein